MEKCWYCGKRKRKKGLLFCSKCIDIKRPNQSGTYIIYDKI